MPNIFFAAQEVLYLGSVWKIGTCGDVVRILNPYPLNHGFLTSKKSRKMYGTQKEVQYPLKGW